ncbi:MULTISPECIES: nucleotidyltransferase domain-containing protein [Bacillus]|uniref:Nucleotidyltransferase domain-containing protein n=1 Tax=Bacillus pseudomycoides TaxID=64104 RepID=A0AAJ1Z349_9BACI|nr:nucleotidyltransferase domain-containing protein [Bacillus pseudomycoides]EEM10915.1 Nucleotidyltransferase [Bacillus pseudomycoides]KFN14273.1 nucleotidyltransferase domain protein [Bacillus pseudomycoides]MCR8858077.1 nucleotidyltransferase domain-containing protein [Bacillus pseudomycoides]MDR4189590.1 nucleotidyltransferase domain-containing protein [Bacillus pseudomycoides]MDR4327408.1 nucleotidyltransferase domain-containing protein [Bacillus pseudomycoides]
MKAIDAAQKIIESQFPHCDVALLGGSIVRGEATKTSDLDIIILDDSLSHCYRESFFSNGWPVEVFVHNFKTYKEYFKGDCKRGRPSLPQLVSEGIILKGEEGIVTSLKLEARQLLDKGPEKWTEELIRQKRYFITDALDDFIGATKREEELFIANLLADLVHEFVLRVNGQWVGNSKWFIRVLRKYDTSFAEEFVEAFDHFYKTGEKKKLIAFVENTLENCGGRLFEGFSIGK